MTRTPTNTMSHAAFDAAVIAAWNAGDDTYAIAMRFGVSESAVHRTIIAERNDRIARRTAA